MKRRLLRFGAFALCSMAFLAESSTLFAQQSQTFSFTGGIQTFTVPCGVDTVFVQSWGAQGGNGATGGNSATGGTGGLGGYSEGYLLVSPGDVLNVFVGGQGATPTGGFNGGANGGSQNAGGGGGASDVRVGGTAESDRVITAGGGGGGGRAGCETNTVAGGNGGSGGGGVGADGTDAPTSSGVAGGGKGGNFGSVQGAAGSAGIGCAGFLGSAGSTASTGTGASGGAGQSCCCFTFGSIPGGGGGGGGQIGGGGGGGGSAGTTGCSGNDKGAGGGGGGGSSYTGGVLNGLVDPGIRLGNGEVIISWNDPIPTQPAYTASVTDVCEGDTVVFTIDPVAHATEYTWTAGGGVSILAGQGTTSISAVVSANGTVDVMGVNATCGFNGPTAGVVNVTFHALPSVSLSATIPDTLCGGMDLTLTGSPAGGTYTVVSGNPAALSANVFNAPAPGTYVVQYDYTDANGCAAMDTMEIVIDCMLGLEMIGSNGSINVYPNPSNGNFTINSGIVLNGKVELIDEMGRVVFSQSVSQMKQKQFEAKGVTTGTYTLKISNGNEVYNGKLQVVK